MVLKVSENPVTSKIPEVHDGTREYRFEKHGHTSTFYMHINPEIIRMIEELRLRSSDGGLTPMYTPNGDLPAAVIIHNDEKALKLKNILDMAGYRVKSSSHIPLEKRMQQQS